jgi:hypothetical protein
LKCNSGLRFCGINRKIQKKQFRFGDFVLWFLKGDKSRLEKFSRKWFGLYRMQYVLPNNAVLIVTLINFEPNLISRLILTN